MSSIAERLPRRATRRPANQESYQGVYEAAIEEKQKATSVDEIPVERAEPPAAAAAAVQENADVPMVVTTGNTPPRDIVFFLVVGTAIAWLMLGIFIN